MVANVKVTVGGKVFQPGEKITGPMSKAVQNFLQKEGYVKEENEDNIANTPTKDTSQNVQDAKKEKAASLSDKKKG